MKKNEGIGTKMKDSKKLFEITKLEFWIWIQMWFWFTYMLFIIENLITILIKLITQKRFKISVLIAREETKIQRGKVYSMRT